MAVDVQRVTAGRLVSNGTLGVSDIGRVLLTRVQMSMLSSCGFTEVELIETMHCTSSSLEIRLTPTMRKVALVLLR